MAKIRVRQAILAALTDEMRADSSVMIMGEDVAVAGGPFKTSEGLLAEFGPLRVRDTPHFRDGVRRGGARHVGHGGGNVPLPEQRDLSQRSRRSTSPGGSQEVEGAEFRIHEGIVTASLRVLPVNGFTHSAARMTDGSMGGPWWDLRLSALRVWTAGDPFAVEDLGSPVDHRGRSFIG